MSVVDEVKQRTDIVEVASQYTSLAKAGRNFRGLCPFHSEKHGSFFVYPEQQSWHCFGACSTGGDVFSLIMKKEGFDFGDALRLLAQRAGVTIPSKGGQRREDKDKNERLYQANETAALYFHHLLLNSPAGEKARSYVGQRGLIAKSVTDFQIGYSPNSWDSLKQHLMERGFTEVEILAAGLVIETESGGSHDRFRHRLMFPIRDIRGQATGFGARALDDSMPKYLNSPETPVFDKSSCLYGINLAHQAIRQQDSAVIVEGYMDVIIAHQNGFSNVIASMGTAITDRQISTLKKLTRNLVFALDADSAGEEASLRGIDYENSLGAEVKVAILPQGKDPDDVIRESPETWQRLLDEAVPIIDYAFNRVTSELDLNTAKGKSLAADRLLPIITGIADVVRQGHYLQKLARLVAISERRLEVAMKEKKPKPSGTRFSPQEEPKAAAATQRSPFASPLEEYCLALLLQHPELKAHSEELSADYFENSENREIFHALQHNQDVSSIRSEIDVTIQEHLDHLISRNLTRDNLEEKLSSSALRLRERYLRGLELKREAILASEATKGTSAELDKLKEQGTDISIQLRDVLIQRSQSRQKPRRTG